MDLFGMDRKFGELVDQDIDDLLDREVFTPPPSNSSLEDCMDLDSPMEDVWFDNFFDDPVLNDRMITDALQPPNVQSEHSYSLTNGNCNENGEITQVPVKTEPTDGDLDPDLLSRMNPVTLTPSQPEVGSLLPMKEEPQDNTEMTTVTVTRTTSAPTSLIKQPTIILAANDNSCFSNTLQPPFRQERMVLPKVNIKVEPLDCSYGSSPDHITVYESPSLPPTPPSSHSSDSEGSLSPHRSSPPSPIRQTALARHQSLRAAAASTQSILSSHSLFSGAIPTSGMLLLTEEERRTLISEGYPIPSKLPLTKQEEKNLKKIRRKIKNKISAQESRRKKKEYMETLEKRVESFSQENNDLRRKVDHLETNNRSLLSQLQKLQNLVSKVRPTTPATQAGTCLMVLVLCFAMFLGSWTPGNIMIGYSSISTPPAPIQAPYPGLPKVEQPGSSGPPMGPHIKDGVVGDAYSTPNMRSRVLLSMKDECEEDMAYGPHAPLSYRELILHWFRPPASHDVDEKTMSQMVQPPLPKVSVLDVESENNQTGEDGKSLASATPPMVDARTIVRPDLSADITPSIMGKRRLETAE